MDFKTVVDRAVHYFFTAIRFYIQIIYLVAGIGIGYTIIEHMFFTDPPRVSDTRP